MLLVHGVTQFILLHVPSEWIQNFLGVYLGLPYILRKFCMRVLRQHKFTNKHAGGLKFYVTRFQSLTTPQWDAVSYIRSQSHAQTPPSHEEQGLVTIERFLGCAESAKCHQSCDLSSATEARVESGHKTTNRSVGQSSTWLHNVALFHWVVQYKDR